jgi:ergothioneine biosynthesis protein EgtB
MTAQRTSQATAQLLPTSDGYRAVRSVTEALAAPLSPEDQTAQSTPDVSPTKWHRAHTTWFFEEFVLGSYAPAYSPADAEYRYLFNSYYEGVGPRHPRDRRGLITRPGAEAVGAYREQVDGAMTDFLAGHVAGQLTHEVAERVELGLHHEQQHQELLLMDIKHVLAQHPFSPVYAPGPRPDDVAAPTLGWVDHDGGLVEMGHPGGGFGFDNEGPRHHVWLEPFALGDRLVTAGEWKAFMDDGGYQRAELWLSDGWHALAATGQHAPLYWMADGDDWDVFTLFGRRRILDAEPVVHLSYYEADAYAHWTGGRLPTEAEWEAIATKQADRGSSGVLSQPVGGLPDLHPTAALDAGPGARQLFGAAWQWTASAYLPYPRFRTNPGVVGEYNGKFMVGQHVLRGSAAITPPGHARVTYRNFFPPSSQWAMSGVRLARDV